MSMDYLSLKLDCIPWEGDKSEKDYYDEYFWVYKTEHPQFVCMDTNSSNIIGVVGVSKTDIPNRDDDREVYWSRMGNEIGMETIHNTLYEAMAHVIEYDHNSQLPETEEADVDDDDNTERCPGCGFKHI